MKRHLKRAARQSFNEAAIGPIPVYIPAGDQFDPTLREFATVVIPRSYWTLTTTLAAEEILALAASVPVTVKV